MARKSLAGLSSAVAASALGVVLPTVALAATPALGLTPTDGAGATFGTITNRVISVILFIGGAAAVLYLLWSGFQYVTAGGDDDKATTARKGIINAIIGIIIISAAYLIFNASKGAVGKTTGSAATGAAANL